MSDKLISLLTVDPRTLTAVVKILIILAVLGAAFASTEVALAGFADGGVGGMSIIDSVAWN